MQERLERICSTISVESVSLTDESDNVITTTGIKAPPEVFDARIRALDIRTPYLELYPPSESDEGEKRITDGTAFVKFPVEGEPDRRLVFEYSCEPLLEIYNTLGNWPAVLERMLSGLEAYGFVHTAEGTIEGYPLDSFTEEEQQQLKEEVSGIFRKSNTFLRLGEGSTYRLSSFRGSLALSVLYPYPYMEAEILMVMPLWSFMSTGVFSALTLSAFIVFSLILFSLYALKLSALKLGARQYETEDRETFCRDLVREARPGRILILAVIACFSSMLLMLENNATIANVGTTKRAALEYEVSWHENQRETISSTYADLYETRTRALAALLTEHKEYRTHSDLQALNGILRADYLMLFDETGQEITSSNSYTGFSVSGPDANLSDEYRAVLLGYPSVVVGPEEDPYSKKQQIGAAILLTEENGEPDGFLLAVFNADAMQAELDNETLEYTVSSFAVTEGNAAAVIDNETGIFLAHTDPKKIGLRADNYITPETYGRDYEGFAEYDGKTMYVSGASTEGKSLLFLAPDYPDSTLSFISMLMVAAVLLVTGLLYCPKACILCAAATEEALENHDITEEDIKDDRRHPLLIFTSGYAVFLTILAGITLFAAYTKRWPAFEFVFSGLWSKGVHLFSLWAALFYVSGLLCTAILLRKALQGTEKGANPRLRTMLKLADSSVIYGFGAVIIIGVLYMFGVNTTALLASAGIVSIAVGMGAKDMAADILAGLFIAIEDSIHMGDVVTIGSWKGCVTDMGIRTIEITDDRQNIKILNNSHVSDVVNMSRRKTACVLELPLKRSMSMAKTEEVLEKVVAAASEAIPELYGSLKLEGVHSITRESYTVRLSYSCAEAAREAAARRLQDFMEKQVALAAEQPPA